jgi:hypothetical protein
MERFHVIDDAAVILRSKGVYRQAKVYRRGKELFAGHGGGFVRLLANNGTSHPNVSWVDTDAQFQLGGRGQPMLQLEAAE